MGNPERYACESYREDHTPEELSVVGGRRRFSTVQRVLVVFAILTSVIMISIAFAPAVQAFAASVTRGYVYDYPEQSSTLELDDGECEFAVGDEHPFDLTDFTFDDLKTSSYYTPIEPMVSEAGQEPPCLSFSEEESRYVYTTDFGVYLFDKADPSVLTVTDSEGAEVARASFLLTGPDPLTCGAVGIIEANESSFWTRQPVFVDDVCEGVLAIKTEFSRLSVPKITASIDFDSVELTSSLSIVWEVEAPFTTLKSEDEIIDVASSQNPVSLPTDVSAVEVGESDMDRWICRSSIDWADAECGIATVDSDAEGIVLTVQFPEGMAIVDPTIVATSTTSYATSGPPFRNTIYHEGTYYLFYHNGSMILYVHSSDGGMEWSTACEVPQSSCSASSSRIFDVALQPMGDRVAVCWIDVTCIFCICGLIDSSTKTIQWGARDLMDSPQSISGQSWFGGVALTEDGTAFVTLFTLHGGLYFKLYTYKAERNSNEFSRFENPFPEYYWTNSYNVYPLVVSAGGGLAAVIVVAKEISTGSCSLYWDEYIPAVNQWFDNEDVWQIGLTSNCLDQQFSACPGVPGTGVDVEVAICYSTHIKNIALTRGSSESSSITVTSPSCASISADTACGKYITYMRDESLHFVYRSIEGEWSDEQPVSDYTDPGADIECPTSGEVFVARHFLSYTDVNATPANVKFCALPIPVDVVGPYSDPWSTPGVNDNQPFSVGASDVISPGNGLLYFFQTDFVIPGRGTDMAVSRFHSSPQYFIRDSGGGGSCQ